MFLGPYNYQVHFGFSFFYWVAEKLIKKMFWKIEYETRYTNRHHRTDSNSSLANTLSETNGVVKGKISGKSKHCGWVFRQKKREKQSTVNSIIHWTIRTFVFSVQLRRILQGSGCNHRTRHEYLFWFVCFKALIVKPILINLLINLFIAVVWTHNSSLQ